MLPTIEWKDDRVVMIDQRKLPEVEVYLECKDHEEVAQAIEKMVIRGAPAIGIAAAFGVVLGVMKVESAASLDSDFLRICRRLEKTRPTARNLFWALERMKGRFEAIRRENLEAIKRTLLREALDIEMEDLETNKKIGFWGKDLIRDGQSILTHCNAGALATAGYGTALGVVRAAVAEGKRITVFANETRPFLQGARLTCWELKKDKIPVVLIIDSTAGYLMQLGKIDLVITGADRIARNGDTANKIGTYTNAVLAKEHGLPFYVAAPLNTVDFSLPHGGGISIEERDPQEVRRCAGRAVSPSEVDVFNPAFDITPSRYITAIVTEAGIARPPYDESLSTWTPSRSELK